MELVDREAALIGVSESGDRLLGEGMGRFTFVSASGCLLEQTTQAPHLRASRFSISEQSLLTIYSYTNMAGTNPYVPSAHPMICRNRVTGPGSTQMVALTAHVLTYGPAPPNYKVVVKNMTIAGKLTLAPKYVENSTGVEMWHHPCSPLGVRGRAAIGNEFSDDRADDVGVFRPPLQPYKAGRLLYKKHDSWLLAAEITADVVQNTHDLLDNQAVSNAALALPNMLYHCADRRTMIFSNEPEIARIFKFFGYDLVILCPLMPVSGEGWDHFWNVENRPPMRFRYGPGEQCRNKFLTLACFPVFRGSVAQSVHWLTVRPTTAYKITWDSYLDWCVYITQTTALSTDMDSNRDFDKLKPAFGWPEQLTTDQLIWTMVAAHRTYANRRLPAGTDLGRWIHQYGGHIKRDPHKTQPFKFDHKAEYSLRRIDFTELGAWVLNNDATLKYVRLWEDANDARMAYMLDRSAQNLAMLEAKENAAFQIP
jgi:hypothetical protein